jgi:hypothetical protein
MNQIRIVTFRNISGTDDITVGSVHGQRDYTNRSLTSIPYSNNAPSPSSSAMIYRYLIFLNLI